MLDITLLGCGGSMPLPSRYLSAVLLRYQGRKILIDCGEGTQVSMKAINAGFKTLDVICITHLHGDHINGLPGLLATLGNSGRVEPILIIGPVGIVAMVEALMVLAVYLPYDVNIQEGNVLNLEYGDLNIQTIELDHSAPCLGYRIEVKRHPRFNLEKALKNKVPKQFWSQLQKGEAISGYEPAHVLGSNREGIKVSFITDTRPTANIPSFIRGSDLFICEGTYAEESDQEKAIANKHMTFTEAATLAKEGTVSTLLLTHFGVALTNPHSYAEKAQEIFKDTVIGEDHFTVTLSFNKSSGTQVK